MGEDDEADNLKGDVETAVFGVGRDIFNLGFFYVAEKRFLYIPYAITYILSLALDKHLNGPVG